jgi:putative redox protein
VADIVVQERGTGKFTQDVAAGRHRLTADEPREAGGDDEGLGPYDYLLAALGACTSMTIRMYAAHKAWPLSRVRVQLRHAKIHAADCADCETKVDMVDRIERDIVLEGSLSEDQTAKLMEIADKCPVHRTLTSEIRIVTRRVA